MVSISSRSSWGARYDDGDKTLSGLAGEVFLHHTVTTQLGVDASVDDERAQMRAIEAIGQSRFATGISYNVVIFPSGRAYQGVSWNRRGTHTAARNSIARSICFAGNYETHEPSKVQLATAAAIVAEGRGKWWSRGAPLRGHRDVKSTACPGKNVYKHRAAIASGEVLTGASPGMSAPASPTPTPAPTPSKPAKVTVDGYWGKGTTTRLQQELGTEVDGEVWHQHPANRQPALVGGWVWNWKAGTAGSPLIRAMQTVMKKAGQYRGKIDGVAGAEFFKGMQRRYRTTVDGELWAKSPTVKAMQRALNAGRF